MEESWWVDSVIYGEPRNHTLVAWILYREWKSYPVRQRDYEINDEIRITSSTNQDDSMESRAGFWFFFRGSGGGGGVDSKFISLGFRHIFFWHVHPRGRGVSLQISGMHYAAWQPLQRSETKNPALTMRETCLGKRTNGGLFVLLGWLSILVLRCKFVTTPHHFKEKKHNKWFGTGKLSTQISQTFQRCAGWWNAIFDSPRLYLAAGLMTL